MTKRLTILFLLLIPHFLSCQFNNDSLKTLLQKVKTLNEDALFTASIDLYEPNISKIETKKLLKSLNCCVIIPTYNNENTIIIENKYR